MKFDNFVLLQISAFVDKKDLTGAYNSFDTFQRKHVTQN